MCLLGFYLIHLTFSNRNQTMKEKCSQIAANRHKVLLHDNARLHVAVTTKVTLFELD